MKQIKLQMGGADVAPVIIEESISPNIDSTYTERTYTGDRIVIRTNQSYGIKSWGSGMPTNGQGVAIYGDTLMRAWNLSTNNFRIYRIGANNVLSELSTSTLNIGHGNALQFAPELEPGQTFPYLYVAGLNNVCHVLSISSDYTVTKVQTITAPSGQVLKGDDGYIWGSIGANDTTRKFKKYRKVEVSEGENITLTDEEDLLDVFYSTNKYPSETYTAQGWKVKNGKIWYCYGAGGAGQNRGIAVYDTDTHRHVATIDLTDFTVAEFEDIELYDNSMILTTFGAGMYILKF